MSSSTVGTSTAPLAASYDLVIGGEHRAAADGATFTAYEPATGEALAEIAQAG